MKLETRRDVDVEVAMALIESSLIVTPLKDRGQTMRFTLKRGINEEERKVQRKVGDAKDALANHPPFNGRRVLQDGLRVTLDGTTVGLVTEDGKWAWRWAALKKKFDANIEDKDLVM